MAQIKNRAGQVFADFNELKKWAEQPSDQHPGYNNVLWKRHGMVISWFQKRRRLSLSGSLLWRRV